MRRFAVLGLFLLVLGAGGLRAQEAEIRSVITRQIEAFEADDFAAAFDFASPGIKRMFGSPERFGEMVREGYPMVWRPGELRFSELEAEGGRMVQGVLVTDRAGAVFMLDYHMIQGEGGWLIDGVTLRRAGDVGA
jgi:hypothetical protein